MGEQIPRYLLVLAGEISSPAAGDFHFGKPQDCTPQSSGPFPGIVPTNTLSHALKTKHESRLKKLVPKDMYLQAIGSKQVLNITPHHLNVHHQMRRKCTLAQSDPL